MCISIYIYIYIYVRLLYNDAVLLYQSKSRGNNTRIHFIVMDRHMHWKRKVQTLVLKPIYRMATGKKKGLAKWVALSSAKAATRRLCACVAQGDLPDGWYARGSLTENDSLLSPAQVVLSAVMWGRVRQEATLALAQITGAVDRLLNLPGSLPVEDNTTTHVNAPVNIPTDSVHNGTELHRPNNPRHAPDNTRTTLEQEGLAPCGPIYVCYDRRELHLTQTPDDTQTTSHQQGLARTDSDADTVILDEKGVPITNPPAGLAQFQEFKYQDAQDVCCVCMDRTVSVTLGPCHHMICNMCRDEINSGCPVCRRNITWIISPLASQAAWQGTALARRVEVQTCSSCGDSGILLTVAPCCMRYVCQKCVVLSVTRAIEWEPPEMEPTVGCRAGSHKAGEIGTLMHTSFLDLLRQNQIRLTDIRVGQQNQFCDMKDVILNADNAAFIALQLHSHARMAFPYNYLNQETRQWINDHK